MLSFTCFKVIYKELSETVDNFESKVAPKSIKYIIYNCKNIYIICRYMLGGFYFVIPLLFKLDNFKLDEYNTI